MATLDWIGKKAVVNHHRVVPYRLLHCDKSKSVGDPDAGNLLVQGDNLEALKALLPYYAGKMKCIYIDPPYNTGNEEWAYNDNVNSPEIRAWLGAVVGKEAEDLSRHDKWLCMMYPRLRILREFIEQDGAVFISCDNNELGNLTALAREIFSRWSQTVIPVVNNLKGRNDKANISQCHDYLVAITSPSFVAGGLPLTEQQKKKFKFLDGNDERYELRDLRKRGGPDTREERPNLFFPIYRLTDGTLVLDEPAGEYERIVPIKSDGVEGRWRWGEKKVRNNLRWLEASHVKRADKWNIGYRVYLNSSVSIDDLAGEAGQLLSEYKKRLRDGEKHEKFVDRVSEELGDILWYVSNVACKYGLSLEGIAEANLAKTRARYLTSKLTGKLDDHFEEIERFPHKFSLTFEERTIENRAEVTAYLDGQVVGATLTDNSYADDGYRFHDVFHVAYAAILGWSPVLRKLMKRKRRSNPVVDEVEDGGRAAVIEEGIAALIFDYARRHSFLDGVYDVDEDLIRTIREMSSHLEVSSQPGSLWRKAILEGFAAWQSVVAAGGGTVSADLDGRTVIYSRSAERPIATAAANVSP